MTMKQFGRRHIQLQYRRELYKEEILSTLNRLWKENGSVKGFRYFADTAYRYSVLGLSDEVQPEVLILGPGIPEALLRAFHIHYRYLLGGSHTMTAWSDDLVPRDTDPVSRSILGSIFAPEGARFGRSLFIIPVSSDSMRKIAYLLKEEGRKTVTLDIPPDHADPLSIAMWEKQLVRMMEAISAHTRRRISQRKIRDAVRCISLARYQLREFLREENRPDVRHTITGSGKLLIQNSYYFADDLDNWGKQLQILRQETGGLRGDAHKTAEPKRAGDRPRILLTGSPIYFPNYKIPFLIEDAGLSIRSCLDVSTIRQEELMSAKSLRAKSLRTTAQAVHALAASSLAHDASAAYTCNDALRAALYREIRSGQIDGIIFHILKGQIEYDFEMTRMEEMFEYYDIPVFRLETDYQDHDIEQLRIRLEAFREMLSQARCSFGSEAV